MFTINQKWLCKLNPALNSPLFTAMTHLFRINFRIAGKTEARRISESFELWKTSAKVNYSKVSEAKKLTHEQTLHYFGWGIVFWNYLQASFSPASQPPIHNVSFEPIHFWPTYSLFQCYSHIRDLINHIHKPYKSYFLHINISPGKLHRVALIPFRNSSTSYLESNNLT